MLRILAVPNIVSAIGNHYAVSRCLVGSSIFVRVPNALPISSGCVGVSLATETTPLVVSGLTVVRTERAPDKTCTCIRMSYK